jgi:hypothetical protein
LFHAKARRRKIVDVVLKRCDFAALRANASLFIKDTCTAHLQFDKPFFLLSQKKFTGRDKKNVQKSNRVIPICTSKFLHQFFHSLLIFKNGKYQNQKILSLSP